MSNDIKKYIGCMEEIKMRTALITCFLKNEKTTGYSGTDAEFVCLQFRKILELIAFASITANKTKYAEMRKKFAQDWNVTFIFKDLERVNPNFYPSPGEQIIDNSTGRAIEVKLIEEGFLTKEEFIKVHEKCGGMLHAFNPYSQSKDVIALKEQFEEWLNRIIKLLSHHQIQLTDSNKMLWVTMKTGLQGTVHVFEMVKIN